MTLKRAALSCEPASDLCHDTNCIPSIAKKATNSDCVLLQTSLPQIASFFFPYASSSESLVFICLSDRIAVFACCCMNSFGQNVCSTRHRHTRTCPDQGGPLKVDDQTKPTIIVAKCCDLEYDICTPHWGAEKVRRYVFWSTNTGSDNFVDNETRPVQTFGTHRFKTNFNS